MFTNFFFECEACLGLEAGPARQKFPSRGGNDLLVWFRGEDNMTTDYCREGEIIADLLELIDSGGIEATAEQRAFLAGVLATLRLY